MYPSGFPSYQSGMGGIANRCRALHRGGLRTDNLPPHSYVLVSAVFHYLGPAFAVLLFAEVGVLGVAWLRIATAAAILAIRRRPWRGWVRRSRDRRQALVAWGVVLAA